MGLRALVGKMALFVIIVIGGPAQVPIFPTRWLIAATIISSRGLSSVDPSSRGEALRLEVARAAITIILIVPTLLMIPARYFQYLSLLRTIKKNASCLLGAK